MVRFNELRITEDRKCLIVDCEIEQIGIYSGMYIDSIYLDYYKNVDASGFPSNSAFLMYKNTDGNKKIRGKRISMMESALSSTEFGIDSFKDGLFYVTVVCDGVPSEKTIELPCDSDMNVNTQAVIDWYGFYERGMGYISSMYGCGADKCNIPAGFKDFVLLWNALKAAIATCNWPLVSKFWDRILRSRGGEGSGSISVGGGCGCGR